MPASHVLGVGAQVRTGLEEPVVEVEVQVMGLNIVHDEHGRNGPGELSERVEDILRLRGDQPAELRQGGDLAAVDVVVDRVPDPSAPRSAVQAILTRTVQPACRRFVSGVKAPAVLNKGQS
jgi:hypothetical protein